MMLFASKILREPMRKKTFGIFDPLLNWVQPVACLELLLLLLLLVPSFEAFSEPAPQEQKRKKAQELYNQGNYNDAYQIFRDLALDPEDDPMRAGSDLDMATHCLNSLNRINEIDAFREEVIKTHKDNWRLLSAAANNYFTNTSYGYIVSGEFHRGQHRGGGRYVNALQRDRVRALQLMVQAMEKTKGEKDNHALSNFYYQFANILLDTRGGPHAWRLQYLTDLSTLPDYEEGYYYYGGQAQGAPVDAEGNPVYHKTPKSYEEAKSDGERWRWALVQVMELSPDRTDEMRYHFANFLRGQFGEQTMASYGRHFSGQDDEDKKDESGTYALHTLGEDETIARLATGVRRFKLPDEFNFIKICKEIADRGRSHYGEASLQVLAEIFANRRQYAKAAEYWQRSIREYGPGPNNHKQQQLDQIIGNWGQFEPIMVQPANQGATVEYRFRNGKQVHFEAHEILFTKLLEDVKAYLRSSPAQLDWERMNLENIGYRLVEKQQNQYLGKQVASWDLDLQPRPHNLDKRITVTTPLQKAGAYLLTAQMAKGNVSRIIVWLADTVIVKKPLDKKGFYFVADARTGRPIPQANLDFFGYRQRHVKDNKYQVDVSQFAELTDADGQVFPDAAKHAQDFSWIITATSVDGRLAYLGYTNVWYGNYYDYEYNQTKVFAITDRPVYRPKQTMKFKFWVREAKYDQEDGSAFAHQQFIVCINSPKGEEIFRKNFTADAYGGFDGEFPLAKEAMLGQYSIYLFNYGSGTAFRVEEYKKPEFEVTVEAPTEPVMLGEKVGATIAAKYYFGAPVTKAKVKYKVLRSSHTAQWYPSGRWDWFYSPGYWWFGCDYPWYPGWREWGCRRPIPWWWNWRAEPPEVVMENSVDIGEDGKVKLEVDTGLAKEIHGDTDHEYDITAEVVDESRRTIVGSGKIMVARKPFRVYGWVDRGHYRVGDVIHAEFSAQTLDNKPVKGPGKLSLLKVTTDEKNQPVETSVQRWDLATDEQGRATTQIKASEAGRYRLSYKVTDSKGHTIEGGYVFNIIGEGFESSQFRFNDIELIQDQREYHPSEKVKLLINTNRAEGTVVLFVRPANGIYLAPKVIRIAGKSAIEEIDVTKKDMPNFFVEAFTISNGKVFSEMKEIIVPPEKRVLNVEVLPSSESYKPGEKAKVKLKLTDFAGNPFVGSLAMTIYDKAVEYISGGSNVAEIKAFFWKWRRSHNPYSESNLNHYFANLARRGEIVMGYLGVFGQMVADEMEDDSMGEEGVVAQTRSRRKEMVKGAMAPRASASNGGGAAKAGMGMADAAPAREMQFAAQADKAVERESGEEEERGQGAAAGQSALVQPTVRTQFADTAFWNGAVSTDSNGLAEIELTMPENLTTWKIKSWAMGHGSRVGESAVEVITTKNLLLRMQSPRFFVEKDEAVLSANVHNYLKSEKSVEVVLELDGQCLEALGNLSQTVTLAAKGEKRIDWRVRVKQEGEAVVRMKALTDEESDAMEMRFPASVHGMTKFVSFSGAMRPEDEKATFAIDVPKERRVNESRLEVRYSPTLAGAMVDALPYLVEYPYGCTEQTLNRFLPTVITQKILIDMKLDLKAIQAKRTNLNAQEIGDDRERATQWKQWERNPVFDVDEVREMIKEGVKRLTDMQVSDGGWGWFSGWGEHSYAHTTAYVVHGFQTARENDVALPPGVLERGVHWLQNYQQEQVRLLKNAATQTHPWKQHADNLDAFVYMVLVDAEVRHNEMLEFLYRDRIQLSVYGKAMVGLACHKQNEKEKLDMIVRNIEQFLVKDEENQTAYLNLPEGFWWHWYGSEYEAHAYYLKLLSKIDPKGLKASWLVKYLLNNRKHATYWNSTRDTALCIEAMADFLKASGESKPDLALEIHVGGKMQKEVKITSENLFTFDNQLAMVGDAVETGVTTIELRKKGTGPLYFNAYLSYFSLEDFIPKAGLEVKVNRKYYKLKKVDKKVKAEGSRGQAVDQKVEKYEREEIPHLATLKSGDLVEIELTIESKNDYEYLVFEDMKAAGFEPVDLRSGYGGNDMGAYMELRDDRVSFFVRWLARGKHSLAYRMRAETPGRFSALPTRAHAMYAPELKANSDEIRLNIED